MKKKIMISIFAVGLAATGYKALKNELMTGEPEESFSVVSWSATEARKDGILIASLEVDPTTLVHDGKEVVIEEAWIEKYAVHRHRFVWLHRRVAVGGFVVAIRPRSKASSDLVLWPKDSGASFAWRGGLLYTFYAEKEPVFPLTVVVSRGRDHVLALILKQPNQSPEPTAGLRPAAAHL